MITTSRVPAPAQPEHCRIHLLGPFRVVAEGRPVALPASTHRLVAFLALQEHPVERTYLSSCLWMDKSEERAAANLRSALWRLRRLPVPLVRVAGPHVALADDVAVDTGTWSSTVRALVDEGRAVDLDAIAVGDLSAELLPSWYDDFVELERERFRQMRLHALESFSRRLSAQGRHAEALDAALAAVAADPLRESAHRAVMQVHLDEGNASEALRQYHVLVDVLRHQLGIAPSPRSRELVGDNLDLQRRAPARPPTVDRRERLGTPTPVASAR